MALCEGRAWQRTEATTLCGRRAPAHTKEVPSHAAVLTLGRVSIQKLKAIHDVTHPGAGLRLAAARAAEVKTEAERAALLQALEAEAGDDD